MRLTHRRFSELSFDEREHEAEQSKLALEAELRDPVEIIAFPYGDPGPQGDLWLARSGRVSKLRVSTAAVPSGCQSAIVIASSALRWGPIPMWLLR